jgi:hypothetical protein
MLGNCVWYGGCRKDHWLDWIKRKRVARQRVGVFYAQTKHALENTGENNDEDRKK